MSSSAFANRAVLIATVLTATVVRTDGFRGPPLFAQTVLGIAAVRNDIDARLGMDNWRDRPCNSSFPAA
ncbi:hypothetical protein QV13_00470 [Mesorhizobium hungaricum]|uniref:Uncharacterized protein n=1 Tax=Mesorhizobium hungaricum TaxID=1566387 RepID=A0A1C2EES7_9HYPH|nr:hypothetical protein [Mesorhizobium sp. YL-MeA3-2017]OCX25475.1 hypothetical protein QV13_00470 [Mesorhizobium hungaricum]